MVTFFCMKHGLVQVQFAFFGIASVCIFGIDSMCSIISVKHVLYSICRLLLLLIYLKDFFLLFKVEIPRSFFKF